MENLLKKYITKDFNVIKNFTVLILICLSGITLFGCAAQNKLITKEGKEQRQRPEWVSAGRIPDYPAPRYIQGIGMIKAGKNMAADKQSADQNAFSEIIKQISAQVSSEFSIKETAVIQNKVESALTRITSDAKVKSNMTVTGLTIVDRFYDPNEKVFYSMGVLDRVTASEPTHQEILQHQKNFQEHLASAMKHRQEGNVYQAILDLREALQVSYKFQENFPSFQLLAGKSLSNETEFSNPPSPLLILNTLSDTISNLNVSIVDGNNQKFIVGKPLNTPLTIRLSLDDKSIIIPAEGFQVTFRFQAGKGELINYVTRTNSEGLASVTASKIERSSEQEYVISAEVSFSDLLDSGYYGSSWNERIPATSATKLFTIYPLKAPPSQKVLVLIRNSDISEAKPAIVRDSIVKNLSEAGFSPVTDSDIGKVKSQSLIDAVQNMQWKTVRQQSPSDIKIIIIVDVSISGFNNSYGLTTCNINGLVKAVTAENGATMVAKSFQDIKGVGTSEAQAADSAYKNAASEIADPLISDLLTFYNTNSLQ